MPTKTPYDTYDVQHFEQWSRDYENSWMQRRLFVPIHSALLDLVATLPTPASVLDVGCGTGRLLRAVAQRWPNAALHGVDPAEGMVAVAQRLTPKATIQRGLAEKLPLPDASVDLAVSTMSFHHWGDQLAGVREIARVLRPDGHFILVDFAPPAALAWISAVSGERAQPLIGRRRIFIAAGLRIQRQQRAVYPLIMATLAVK
jgi:ubiquinone/menaquinone biosynthesis C-methylase UbiE